MEIRQAGHPLRPTLNNVLAIDKEIDAYEIRRSIMTYFTPTWQPYHEYIGKMGLLELGLWTEALTSRLPPPEELGGNLARPRNNDTNPYWKWITVADLLAEIHATRIEELRNDYYSQVHEDDGLSMEDEDARYEASMQEADGLSFEDEDEDEDARYNYYVQPREETGLPAVDEAAWYTAEMQKGCYGLSFNDSDDAPYDALTDDTMH